MKANVGHINLHLFIILILLSELATSSCLDSLSILYIVITKLLPDFKESFFYFFLYLRLELLLHVVHFKVLTFKMLQRMWTFVALWLHEAIHGLSIILNYHVIVWHLLLSHRDLWKRALDWALVVDEVSFLISGCPSSLRILKNIALLSTVKIPIWVNSAILIAVELILVHVWVHHLIILIQVPVGGHMSILSVIIAHRLVILYIHWTLLMNLRRIHNWW